MEKCFMHASKISYSHIQVQAEKVNAAVRALPPSLTARFRPPGSLVPDTDGCPARIPERGVISSPVLRLRILQP